MSDDVDNEADDTISVPLPVVKEESEGDPQAEEEEVGAPLSNEERFEQTVAGFADVRTAINTLERTLDVARVAFENLKTLVFGDGEAIVHAWPLLDMELMPCCGRKMMDVPLTERIAIDPSEITCGKAPV
jgi:hypothetical protein